MADTPVVHIGENSPEEVAYRLLKGVALSEDKKLASGIVIADRAWLLRAYSECLYSVKTGRYSKAIHGE
jgi:hypothetical protein